MNFAPRRPQTVVAEPITAVFETVTIFQGSRHDPRLITSDENDGPDVTQNSPIGWLSSGRDSNRLTAGDEKTNEFGSSEAADLAQPNVGTSPEVDWARAS
jgi:hypothetical protein